MSKSSEILLAILRGLLPGMISEVSGGTESSLTDISAHLTKRIEDQIIFLEYKFDDLKKRHSFFGRLVALATPVSILFPSFH